MKCSLPLLILLFCSQLIIAQNLPGDSGPAASNTVNVVQNTDLFKIEFSYLGDFAGNAAGGIKKGIAYLGMANIKLSLQPEYFGLWKGGELFIMGSCTHGGTPSTGLIGDLQVASNIEAGNHIYLQELWYRQTFEHADIILGLQNLNAEFINCENAGDFLNSSFGIPSLVSDNIPVPIFPLTALGFTGKYHFNEKLELLAAVYDGMPEDFSNNRYNINWKINSDNGALIISELRVNINPADLPGTLKFGGYYHNRLREDNEETGLMETLFDKNYGFYFIADQILKQSDQSRCLGVFIQAAISPADINKHNYYLGGGFSYSGLFSADGSDMAGIAAALAGFHNTYIKNETAFEFFYKVTVSENLFIQPDIQYIINPAGTEENLNNALAGIMRIGISF